MGGWVDLPEAVEGIRDVLVIRLEAPDVVGTGLLHLVHELEELFWVGGWVGGLGLVG